jgi:hypothetical protein
VFHRNLNNKPRTKSGAGAGLQRCSNFGQGFNPDLPRSEFILLWGLAVVGFGKSFSDLPHHQNLVSGVEPEAGATHTEARHILATRKLFEKIWNFFFWNVGVGKLP